MTFTTQSVVCVHVQNLTDTQAAELLGFLSKEKAYPTNGMPSSSGAGEFFGFFSQENAEKVKHWLLEKGAEQ